MNAWVDRLGWALIHFLWQGALIALLYLFARKSRTPQTRYFLGCFALAAMAVAPLVTFALGGQPEPGQTQPFPSPVPTDSANTEILSILPPDFHQTAHNEIMPWLVMAWFAGALFFWLRLTGSWIFATRMRSMQVRPANAEWQRRLDELRTRISVWKPVRLLSSAIVRAPTVVGWLRPVILMPIGALARLPAEQIEALLAHELAHIRRHDYLVNILQSIAEALLFYHPAVWWISTQIRNERELCCDDVAVAISGDPLTYARALADLEQQRPGRLTPALAANGGSLADRIARLLGQSRNSSRTSPGPAILFATILLAVTGYALFAQTNTPDKKPLPSFEAVSIKPNNLGGGHSHQHDTPGRFNASMTTKRLIETAFGVKDFQVTGGPSWLDQANYDIVAKTPTPINMTRKSIQPYLQSLLAERYQLKYHTESKEFPGYALVVAKSGSKLRPHTGTEGPGADGDGDGKKNTSSGTDLSAADIADFLATEVNQAVLDQTRLKGRYDFKMEWTNDDSGQSPLPTLFTALQEQLGLRLESSKVPMEVIVVDSVEKPSEN